ncbi:MAG: mandelate racemase/muconate lactonizing enzyme family protein [Actinomycetota bacterium]
MQITEVRVYRHSISVANGRYQMALSEVDALDCTVVELVTDAGLIGYGETTPLGPTYQEQHAAGARAAIATIAPALIGLDPRRTNLVYERMDQALNGHRYAKSAIDVACWDLTGKAYEERVCDLLGGTERKSVPSYYGVMPATVARTADAARKREAEGYPRIQVKAGGRPLAEDIETVRAVAEALSPATKLLVDPNRGWTGRDTLEFSVACRDVPLTIEQPCRTYDEHRRIADKLHHPLFLDESTVDIATIVRAVADGVAQGFGMKLSRVGGLTPLRTVRDLCVELGVPLTIDDTWGGDLTAAATVHMGATVPEPFYEGTWISHPYQKRAYGCLTTPVRHKGGHIPLPKGVGLGVEPDLATWPDPVAVTT